MGTILGTGDALIYIVPTLKDNVVFKRWQMASI